MKNIYSLVKSEHLISHMREVLYLQCNWINFDELRAVYTWDYVAKKAKYISCVNGCGRFILLREEIDTQVQLTYKLSW